MVEKTTTRYQKWLDAGALESIDEIAKPIYDDPMDNPMMQLIEKYGKDGRLLLRFKRDVDNE